MMCLNFFNKLIIRFDVPTSPETLFLQDQYAPYVCDSEPAGAPGDISFDVVDKIDVRNLIFIGKEAAYGDGTFYILDAKKKKMCFDFDKKMTIEKGFSIGLLEVLFRSWILTRLIDESVVPVHGSSACFQEEGVLIAGWGGTGKTRMLLNSIDSGARCLCDEWTLIVDQFIYPLTQKILLCDYDMKEFPKYAKLNLCDWIRRKLNCFLRVKGVGQLLRVSRLCLAAKIFNAENLFSDVASKVALKKIYFIQVSDEKDFRKGPIELSDMINKLSEMFIRENSRFFYYHGLYRYAFPYNENIQGGILEKYKEISRISSDHVKRYLLTIPQNSDYKRLKVDWMADHEF